MVTEALFPVRVETRGAFGACTATLHGSWASRAKRSRRARCAMRIDLQKAKPDRPHSFKYPLVPSVESPSIVFRQCCGKQTHTSGKALTSP